MKNQKYNRKVNLLTSILLFFSLFSYVNANESKFDAIIKSNTLKVCVWPEYYGISYLDTRTQKLVGIDSDLAKELAKDLEVNLEYVSSSFSTLISDIKSNICDIAMYAIGYTQSRKNSLRFTSAHLHSDIYAITTKKNQKINTWTDIDKKGIVVAVAKGTYHVSVMKKKLKHAKLVVLNSLNARQIEVQAGRVDVFMTDYPYGKKMIEKTTWAKLITPEKTYHMTPYAWVMAYGYDKFYKRVESFIDDIKTDGRLLDLAKKNGLEQIVNLDYK